MPPFRNVLLIHACFLPLKKRGVVTLNQWGLQEKRRGQMRLSSASHPLVDVEDGWRFQYTSSYCCRTASSSLAASSSCQTLENCSWLCRRKELDHPHLQPGLCRRISGQGKGIRWMIGAATDKVRNGDDDAIWAKVYSAMIYKAPMHRAPVCFRHWLGPITAVFSHSFNPCSLSLMGQLFTDLKHKQLQILKKNSATYCFQFLLSFLFILSFSGSFYWAHILIIF
jgi:hypothetical protein